MTSAVRQQILLQALCNPLLGHLPGCVRGVGCRGYPGCPVLPASDLGPWLPGFLPGEDRGPGMQAGCSQHAPRSHGSAAAKDFHIHCLKSKNGLGLDRGQLGEDLCSISSDSQLNMQSIGVYEAQKGEKQSEKKTKTNKHKRCCCIKMWCYFIWALQSAGLLTPEILLQL